MKRTILGTLTVILGVAVFSVLAGKQIKNKDRVQLDPTIRVINLTKETYMDTVVNVGANLLEIKNITIVVVEMPAKELEDSETLLGYITDKQTYYLIKLRPNLYRDFYTEIVAHEIIHGRQMCTGKLVEVPFGVLYDNQFYPWNYPYYLRPWEEIAFKLETPLKIEILNKINYPLEH